MSGLKDPHVAQFLRMVRHRLGGNGGLGTLCNLADLGRAHVSQVINGANGRMGYNTWARLRRHCMAREWAELEQSAAWNIFQNKFPLRAAQAREVPLCDDPLHPIMPVVCCVCHRGITVKSCRAEYAGQPSHTYCDTHLRLALQSAGMPAEQIDAEVPALALSTQPT